MTAAQWAEKNAMRLNLRQRRADALAHAIMHAIWPHIPDCDHTYRQHTRWKISEALRRLLMDEGVEVLTDHTRHELGLPPRDPDGWTADEIVAMERVRLELMLRPLHQTMEA
jgi:hypothetical protein